MNICYVINNLAQGGAEEQIINIANNMSMKHDVSIILLNNKISKERMNRIKNVRIFILTESSRYSFKIIFKLISILKKNNYDIIHTNLFPTFYYIGLLKPILKSKLVYTEHSINNNRKNNKLFNYIDNIFLNRYDFITCVSEATMYEMFKSYKINVELKVINNGIDLNKFREHKRKFSRPIIIMVSRFTHAKDHITLVSAFDKLSIPNKKLLLVGKGPNLHEIKNYVKNNKISEVEFLGNRQDIPDLLNKAYIYVQSSNWESFGIAAVEAMAKGLPVVHTQVEGLKDVVNQPSLSFEVGDKEKLTELLEKLLSIREFWEESSAHSLEQSEKYNIKNIVVELESIYKNLLSPAKKW